MAKKKDLRGRADSDVNAPEKADSQKGLSQGAWVTIGTIAAAIITGVFALITHLLPQASPASLPAPTPTIASSTPGPVASLRPIATTADAIAGKWSGTAQDSNGKSFQITLDVRKSCSLKERCGSISVSHVPCEGEIFLEKAEDDGFEFRVTNFYGHSNRDVCQSGAGEHFKLRPDGKLAYTTTYEPEAQGILGRID